MTATELFKASEMMDMAIRIENQGLRFYEACSASQTDPDTKDVFRYLKDQESEHARVFSRMKEKLPEDDTLPETYSGEMQDYMDAFVRGKVFEDPAHAERVARETEDPVAAVDFGLEIEKASILFYSGMKQFVRDSDIRELDQVIAEEDRHVRRLLALRRGYGRKSGQSRRG